MNQARTLSDPAAPPGVKLYGATLSEANLQGTALVEAHLQGTWLIGSSLRGARSNREKPRNGQKSSTPVTIIKTD